MTAAVGELEPVGTVSAVNGDVVDAVCRQVPPIRRALRTADGTVLEVHQHLDPERVRAIAMHPAAGLRRGMPLYDTGGPICVPVTPQALGRVVDLFGVPLDGGPALDAARTLSLIHI